MLTRNPNMPRIPADEDIRPHAIVIGSGFGGLAAAVRLGAKGYRVTVLERLERIGGRASVLRQDGFTFDRGPTIVTAPFLFEELWALCGRRLEDDVVMKDMKPFYTVRFDDGDAIACSNAPGAMRREVERVSPDDLAGYDRFMEKSAEICRVGFEQLGDQPFLSPGSMLSVAPDLLKLQGWRSVHGLVSRYVKHPKLRFVLSFHPLLIGGNPFRAPAIYCLIPALEHRWGVHYPIGGVTQLVDGLASLIEGQGGTIELGADVAQILVKEGAACGVRLADERVLKSDVVVSNADAAFTYGALLQDGEARRWRKSRLDRARYSMGLAVCYFGTSRRFEAVGHHTILLGPRYRGLLHDMFERKRLTDDFSLYVHRPSASDPSVAPEGCDAFYALCPVPNNQSGIDWSEEGPRRRDAIVARLEATILPGLSRSIISEAMMTPDDFASDYQSPFGAGFSLEPTLMQSAWFRPTNSSEDIANLYLVGAGTHPGAGLPGVLSSAKILERLVPDAASFAR